MAEWLARFEWQIWATLTFDSKIETGDTFTALRRFERFIKQMEKTFKTKLDYVCFVERFHSSDKCHLHVLIKGFDLTPELYKDVWTLWFKRYGRATVEEYEQGKGAEYYLTKYVTKDICDWRVQIR